MGLNAVVLAAGQGKRMKSKLYKVLHPVCGKPMVLHVIGMLEEVGADRLVTVVGHGADSVKSVVGDRSEYALQAEQLGTGHAVMQACDVLGDADGITVIVCGDTPLLTAETIRRMVESHRSQGAAATMLTAMMPDPGGYGRVIRSSGGSVSRIVEQKDCTPEQLAVREINAGVYAFDHRKLADALKQVNNDNAQGEYYLTDVIGILVSAGERVDACVLDDVTESLGVNDRIALAEAEEAMRRRILRKHMAAGVTMIDPQSTYIDADVVIGADTVIEPGTILRGRTVIGEDCRIGPHADITDSVIGPGTTIRHAVLLEARTGAEVNIGPYAYLRPGTKLGDRVKVGDFVEIKNAVVGEGSKVPHLSYVGDADVGSGVNIGCGAITVNYNGVSKSRTVIENDAFVGSNVNLIAPVTIGQGAYVVAGSTITNDVPSGDLAIARERQTNKPGYAAKLKARFAGKPKSTQ